MSSEQSLQYGHQITMKELIPLLVDLYKVDRSVAVALWGSPGTGKTAATRQIAEGANLRYLRHGFSTIDYIQVGGIPEIVEADGNKHAVRYPIIEIPSKGEGLLVLDDFTRNIQAVQNLGLDLFLERKVNDAKLAEGWAVIACSNVEGHVHPMDTPIANRMIHFYVRHDIDSFTEWALRNDIRAEVLAFLSSYPDRLYLSPENQENAFATPRIWETLGRILDKLFPQGSGSLTGRDALPKVRAYAAASVGQSTASLFTSYLSVYGSVDLNSVLAGTHKALDTIDSERNALDMAVIVMMSGWWSSLTRNGSAKAKEIGMAKIVEGVTNALGYLGVGSRSVLLRYLQVTSQPLLSRAAVYVDKHVGKTPSLRCLQDLLLEQVRAIQRMERRG